MSRDELIDEELAKAKQSALAEMLGKKQVKPRGLSTRKLTPSQATALKALENGDMFEIVERVIDYGDPDPVAKQVDRWSPQRKALVVSIEVYPEEKRWIEHILLMCVKIELKKKEVELVKKHIKRLNYEGALRDYYEFYGLNRSELKDLERAEREEGHFAKADRLKMIIERI